MLRLLFFSLFLSFFASTSFAYSVGKAKIIECAANHSGSCRWLVSKEFINSKNKVTASISLYQQYTAVFSVKQVVSVKKLTPEGSAYEIQVIGDWKISPDQRKKLLKKRPMLKFIKIFKKQKRNLWVEDESQNQDLFAAN